MNPPKSRNDPCPCGSGKRYKHCHGGDVQPATARAPMAADAADPLAMARAALRAGRHAEAARIVVAHHGEAPADFAALKVFAEALRPTDAARSRECWERALRAEPDDPEALFFVGDFCREAGEHARAIELFERALVHAPDHPALLNNLGLALEKDGRLDKAEPMFRRALEIEPDSLNALANLAQNLYQQWRHKEAIPLFDRLIERMPEPPAAIWANRAVSLRACGDAVKAEASLKRAVELVPDSAEIWCSLGLARIEQQAFGPAAIALERAVALDLDDAYAECLLLHSHAFECVWRDFDASRARILDTAMHPESRRRGAVVPFVLQTLSDDPALELAVARRWSATQYLPAETKRPPRRTPDGRLNLGFVSSDFHEHPVGRLIVGLFERLDRRRFRVFAYSPGAQKEDSTKARLKAAVDGFRVFPMADAGEVADAVRADGIDVAFDLTGYTGATMVDILALRPAPVQINFLGFTGTMGSSAFDWILTDRYCVPPEDARHYDEKPLYVDPCYLPSDAARVIDAAPMSRRNYGLREDAVVYAALMAPYKIPPALFDAWLTILGQVDGSVLWMREQSSGMAARLRDTAKARGVDPQRLTFSHPEPIPRYLARFRLADVFLDSAPFGSHTTVNDALFAGLPVIALAGRSFAARASASQVRAAGLDELVVDDLDGYLRTAVALGRDPARLRGMGARLRERRDTLPLFDLDHYARSFEAAIERAWAETPVGS
jgi:predicted O-linked N-acetylglucosamine transferase (SPINDLY family)